MKTTYALLITGLAAQNVAATWNFFENFATPKYSKNECSDGQKTGFDWADLQDGAKVDNYGDFSFSSGWTCANSFGKRDALSKRSFGNKCIKNKVSKAKPASFGCDKRGFSITHMDVSAEFDAELELHYKMGDGSICKQMSSCSAGGSTLQNTQCGGAKSVEVYLGSHHKGNQEACEIGFHNIGFDCDSETSYTTPALPSIPSTSAIVESSAPPASSTASSCNGEDCNAQTTPPAVETPATSASECDQYGGGCNTAVETPTPEIPASPLPPFTNSSMPAYTPPQVTPPTIESSTVTPEASTSASVAPPTEESSAACGYGQPCGESTVVESSTVVVPPTSESSAAAPSCGYGQSCDGSTDVASSMASSAGNPIPATSTVVSEPPTPTYTPVDITDVVPKCMNSWLQISASGCKDNTDSKCYCVKSEFTKNVIDCISARCGSDEDTSVALQYFIGICAEHIPENPNIVGDCPSYIPLNPTPEATPTGGASSSPAPEAPVSSSEVDTPAAPSSDASYPVTGGVTTTAAIETPVASTGGVTEGITTTAVGETPATKTPCTTITYGTTTLTVPQVHFTTQITSTGASAGANPTEPIALVPGTEPAETPAATTSPGVAAPPYPIPSTLGTAPMPIGTATGTGAVRPSSPPQFTGAASPFSVVPQHALLGAALAFFAL
ncbi:hypothetical protein BDW02DRAFT_628069 [Decorospora gaudefroyi]|uniref:CFEM domain-containing protein n=1 Tax=Decorospora gaudefroyi TaxID=184978 RepID=A0A6A5KN85_9PLEO|nr:hypothetical protein BDW02DRAFT_628069 [Decorospora gaudefroyi]